MKKDALKRLFDAGRSPLRVEPVPGALTPDGVYVGTWSQGDLGKTFRLFAAPEDLPGSAVYDENVKIVASLQNWHGFNGEHYAEAREIITALKSETYKGGWIIPTSGMLCGWEEGSRVACDSLLAQRDKGVLKDTFRILLPKSWNYGNMYCSSTLYEDNADYICYATLAHGTEGEIVMKHGIISREGHLGCRPVRLVEVKL